MSNIFVHDLFSFILIRKEEEEEEKEKEKKLSAIAAFLAVTGDIGQMRDINNHFSSCL